MLRFPWDRSIRGRRCILNGKGRSVMHRAVNSFLRFELSDKCSKARGDGSCDCVVLILEASPNCRRRNASIASGIQPALSGMRSVTIPNDNADGSNSQSGRLFEPRRRDHSLVGQLALSLSTWGRSLRVVGRLLRAEDRLTIELNCQSEDVRAASVMAARASHISSSRSARIV
jgi:hypothetical protein